MEKQKFLDKDGLQIVIDKIMEQINNQFNLVINDEDGSLSLVYDETTT